LEILYIPVYFKGGFPSVVLYKEEISKLKYERINFRKLKIDSVYFKGEFPSVVPYKEEISKLKYERINFRKLKIDWKKYF